jgi:hypothetical protein
MPKRPMTISRTIVIAVDRPTVYRAISDPRETTRWSPENTGARLDAGGTASSTDVRLTEGDTFVGSNKRGRFRWVTRCKVLIADQDQAFGFRVQQIGIKQPKVNGAIAVWEYRLRDVDGGTEVTETWTDLRTRWPDAAARVFDFLATRGSRFAEFNTRNIDTTLANLKRTLEAA